MRIFLCFHRRSALTWLFGGLAAVGPLLINGPTLAACAVSVGGIVLVRLAVIDITTLTLPNGLTRPLLWGGLLANSQQLFVAADQAIIGAVAGWAVFTLVRGLYRLFLQREGLGGGDVKLFAALGAWGGPLLLVPMMGTAALLGIATCVLMWASGRHAARVPFGPALALSGWGWLMWSLYCSGVAIG
ncbi:prepilin peptidase [Carnimonas bestiolae]|uniref:prepilin peptidase n=1 Tax=Carnimonas bestiolae TaxID=3402172 RepID=UPI003EDC405E